MSKIVLVTGANGGIGIEICKKFKSNNWIVIGTSLINKFIHDSIDLYISARPNTTQTKCGFSNAIKKHPNQD